jgi:hypothetical protein
MYTFLFHPSTVCYRSSTCSQRSILVCLYIQGIEVFTQLLERGANPNIADSNGRYPLDIAAQRYNISVIKMLLSKGALPLRSSLLIVLKSARIDVVQLLIEKKVPVSNDVIITTVKAACESHGSIGHRAILSILLQSSPSMHIDNECVIHAAHHIEEHHRLLSYLIGHGGDIDSLTPMITSLQGSDPIKAKLLMDAIRNGINLIKVDVSGVQSVVNNELMCLPASLQSIIMSYSMAYESPLLSRPFDGNCQCHWCKRSIAPLPILAFFPTPLSIMIGITGIFSFFFLSVSKFCYDT